MKLLFSETTPDYGHYVFPYVVWGFPEPGETPADAYAAGFLPGTPAMERYYLCRQVRVPLAEWKPTSENRRVLRKSEGLRCELVPRAAFACTGERRERWLAYAAEKWGEDILSPERLDRMMAGAVITHLLHFTDAAGADVGTALCFLEAPRVAHYYYAFYQLAPETKHIGMAMMTRAVEFFAAAGFTHVYLGTCYSEAALYKTQFEPLEFFNGFRWSRNVAELKHLVRAALPVGRHRLETPEFLAFQPAPPPALAEASPWRRESGL